MTGADPVEGGGRYARPPAELEAAVERALSEVAVDRMATEPDRFLAAAEQLLERVLASECAKRESALDLLTVDALVTRALAIANEDATLIEVFPKVAMGRVAGLSDRNANDH